MNSVVRISFFLTISFLLHLLWFAADLRFPAGATPQPQVSFSYTSSSRELFVPAPKKKQSKIQTPARSHQTFPLAVKTKSVIPPVKKITAAELPVQKKARPVKKNLLPAPTENISTVIPEPLPATSPVTDGAAAASDIERSPVVLEKAVATTGEVLLGSDIAETVSDPSPPNEIEPTKESAYPDKGSGSAGFVVALPRYATNPKPNYPEVARRRGWEGTALFEVLVAKNGRVEDIDLVQSSGYKSLDRAARKSIKRWTFKPATSFGTPIASRVILPIDFALDQ